MALFKFDVNSNILPTHQFIFKSVCRKMFRAAVFVLISLPSLQGVAGTVVAWGLTDPGPNAVPSNLTNVVAISSGWNHSLALRDNGTIVAWGSPSDGKCNVPLGLTNVVALAAGYRKSLAAKNDGQVEAWGAVLPGQSIALAGLSNAVSLAAAVFHDVVLKSDGTVALWGSDFAGQLGLPGNLNHVVAVAAEFYQTLSLLSDGTLLSWGYDGDYYYPTQPPAEAGEIVSLAAGSYHNLALRADGTIIAWGRNDLGQLNVPVGASNVVAVAARDGHSAALKADGTVVVWGSPEFAAGNAAPPGVTNLVSIALESQQAVGLVGNGAPSLSVWRSHYNSAPGGTVLLVGMAAGQGELFFQWRKGGAVISGATNRVIRLTNLQAADAGIYSLVVSNSIGATVSPDAVLHIIDTAPFIVHQPKGGDVMIKASLNLQVDIHGSRPQTFRWFHDYAELTGETNSTLHLPEVGSTNFGGYQVVVSNAFGVVTSVVAALRVTSIGVWGRNDRGQAAVSADATNVVAAAGGLQHSVGIRKDGSLVVWGDSTLEQANIPAAASNIVSVAVSGAHNLALRNDGVVFSWGDPYYELQAIPTKLTNVVAIATTFDRAFALQADGQIIGWDGSPVERLSDVVAIDGGLGHVMALLADGSVSAFGDDSAGQSSVPLGLNNVIAIAAGGYHSLAVRYDGTVVAWGLNDSGQTDIPSGLSNVVAVAAGDYHSLALRRDGALVAWGANLDQQCSSPYTPAHVTSIGAGSYHSFAIVDEPFVPAYSLQASQTDGALHLDWSSKRGHLYVVECVDSLGAGAWQFLRLVRGDGGWRGTADPIGGNGRRFYRARRL